MKIKRGGEKKREVRKGRTEWGGGIFHGREEKHVKEKRERGAESVGRREKKRRRVRT